MAYKALFLFGYILFSIIYVNAVPVDSLFCKDRKDGKYPHPSECRVYYVCSKHMTSVQSCPQGMAFNKSNAQCDVPENVNSPCGSKRDTILDITVDGNLADWPTNFVSDEDNQLDYAVYNDNENIYIAIRKDRSLMKLLSGTHKVGGLQLYINPNGIKDTVGALNIGYPLTDEVEGDWQVIRIKNLTTQRNAHQILSTFNEFGILVASAHQFEGKVLKNYTAEYKIPLVNILPHASKSRKIAICIILKGIHWSSRPIFPPSPGSIVYFPNDFPYSKEDMMDSMDWSFRWFDYKF